MKKILFKALYSIEVTLDTSLSRESCRSFVLASLWELFARDRPVLREDIDRRRFYY
jgi:hypothetical protein